MLRWPRILVFLLLGAESGAIEVGQPFPQPPAWIFPAQGSQPLGGAICQDQS